MARTTNYFDLIYLLFIVMGVVFSILQAIFKGKKIDLDTIFETDTSDATESTADEEPIMVVDEQGNLITPKKSPPRISVPPALPPQAVAQAGNRPPRKKSSQRQPVRPRAGSSTAGSVLPPSVLSDTGYTATGSGYVDFIRNHADTAIVMQEILGKPKALR